MNCKQKLSLVAASLLPMLALCCYLLIAPVHVSAFFCDPPSFYDPGGNCGQGCGDGTGGCILLDGTGTYDGCPPSGGDNARCVTPNCVECVN